ncbi:MAG: type III-A CRISPR-associated RAMP protein Csm5 [Coleofasciculaceae cyanobacterium]
MTTFAQTSLTKPKVYESKTIQLTSPMLHIGSEVSSLNPFEYVQTASKVYLPNQEALAKALQKQGGSFLQDYIEAIENQRPIESLLRQAFGDNWTKAKSPEGVEIFPDVRSKWMQQENQQVTDLRPMIRNGMGKLYIPGSSIKGAIRTAIAYYLLKHADKYQVPSSHRVSDIELKLREKLNAGELNSKWKQKFADDELFMNNLFSNYSLYYQDKERKTKSIQNTDILRAIHVSDSQPLLKYKLTNKRGKSVWFNAPVVAEVVVSSHFQDWRAKCRAPIYTEIVYSVRTEFTLTLDKDMLKWFRHRQGMKLPFQNLDELLNICQEFAQAQWDSEVKYWENIGNNRHQGKYLNFDLVWERFYSKPQCPYSLRFGWGSGMLGTTINCLFQEETRAELRDACGIAAPNFEAPKSRRTIVNSQGEISYVPGWVKFKS